MERLIKWIKLIVTSNSGISSKRVCGVFGFITIMFVLIYCSILSLQAPEMIETFIWATCVLLGIDSLVSPWLLKYKNSDNSNKE